MLRYKFVSIYKLMNPSGVMSDNGEWIAQLMTKDISIAMNNARQRMHHDMIEWLLPDSLKGIDYSNFNYTEHSLFATVLSKILSFSRSDIGWGGYAHTIEGTRVLVENKHVKLCCPDSELVGNIKKAVIKDGGTLEIVNYVSTVDWWLSEGRARKTTW